jgi:hypothetical protein
VNPGIFSQDFYQRFYQFEEILIIESDESGLFISDFSEIRHYSVENFGELVKKAENKLRL